MLLHLAGRSLGLRSEIRAVAQVGQARCPSSHPDSEWPGQAKIPPRISAFKTTRRPTLLPDTPRLDSPRLVSFFLLLFLPTYSSIQSIESCPGNAKDDRGSSAARRRRRRRRQPPPIGMNTSYMYQQSIFTYSQVPLSQRSSLSCSQ